MSLDETREINSVGREKGKLADHDIASPYAVRVFPERGVLRRRMVYGGSSSCEQSEHPRSYEDKSVIPVRVPLNKVEELYALGFFEASGSGPKRSVEYIARYERKTILSIEVAVSCHALLLKATVKILGPHRA